MSRIALAPNASGTGTLSIASPNTNSDYTLTLPAETGTMVVTDGTTLYVDNANDRVGIGTSSPSAKLTVTGLARICDASAYLLFRNAADSTSNGVLQFPDSGAASLVNYRNEAMYFGTNNTERMRIDSGGAVLMGKTVTNDTTQGFAWRSSGYVSIVRDGGAPLSLVRNSSTGEIQEFFYNTTKVGSISTNGSNTAYNTSSDYRLKENIAPMTGALATVQQLNPVTYNWKLDGSAGQGFIAHELQAVVPDCVTGEKDAVETYVDEEGVEQTRPVYQGIDTSFLVATLTAAIKELKAELDAAKDRIAALEGANNVSA